ncbi:MAG: HU family DNA-binding protein [Proteobacteria bacterium]|nr:HU family DNA-binding protein [Pseudomonadota bacterium]
MATVKAKAKTKVLGKKDVIDSVAKKANLSKKDAQNAVKALMDTVKENLKKGVTVRLIPFGNFEVRKRAGRVGRNPRTNEKIEIKSRNVPAFRPGKELKDAVK